jgi:hypothetical protein
LENKSEEVHLVPDWLLLSQMAARLFTYMSGGIMSANPDTQQKSSEWLVMVYAAGDNNLSANSIALMQDLEASLSGNP